MIMPTREELETLVDEIEMISSATDTATGDQYRDNQSEIETRKAIILAAHDAMAMRVAELEDESVIWEKASVIELRERCEEQNKRIIDLERQTAILKKGYEYALKFLDILAGDMLELEREIK